MQLRRPRTGANIAANIAGKAWSVLSVYLFAPVYLRYLGVDAFGILGFYGVLQGLLAFADLGLSATLSRELAKLSGTAGSAKRMRDLVRTVEAIYLGIASFVALGIVALAGVIASHWIRSETLSPLVVRRAIQLMGIAIALQLPTSMYLGGLLGLQRQVASNLILVSSGVLRGAGAVMALWVMNSVVVFFFWQVLANVFVLVLVRQTLWGVLPAEESRARFDLGVLRSVAKYTFGMIAISVNVAVLAQADKLVVSRMLPLATLGYYTIASTIAQVPMLLSGPIASALFPRFTVLASTSESEDELRSVYHQSCTLVAVVVYPVGLIVLAFAPQLIELWTRSGDVAGHAGPIGTVLIVGTTLWACLALPYGLALAGGWTSVVLRLEVPMTIVSVPALVIATSRWGVLGAAITWTTIQATALPIFIRLLHRRILNYGDVRKWYLRDNAIPFGAALVPVVIGRIMVAPGHLGLRGLAAVGAVGLASLAMAAVAGFGHPRRWGRAFS